MAFLEDYTLLDELGQGGYATVYKVRHNNLGYIRAIRVLNAIIAHGESDKIYQKFLEECRLLLRLGNGNHPNIVHIYQPLLKSQRAIVEMDFVDGKNLYHYLKEKHSFVEIKDVLKLLMDIGSALAYCHEDIYKFCMDKDEDELQDDPNDGSKVLLEDKTKLRLINKYRVIHNDIHSGNIVRREDGSYILLDFGLAIEGNCVVRSSRRKNGVPEFKAPEKWDNESTLTTQSDIYSFGVVLYEYLAGRVPFLFDEKNSNPAEAEYLLCRAHKEQGPTSIFELRRMAFESSHPGETYEKDYPDWLEKLIMKCLAKSAEDRFKNGKDLYSFVLKNISNETDKQVENLKQELIVLQNKIVSLNENGEIRTKNTLNKILKVLFVVFLLITSIGSIWYFNKDSFYTTVNTVDVEIISECDSLLNNSYDDYKQINDNATKNNSKFIANLKSDISVKDAQIKKLSSKIQELNQEISTLKSRNIGENSQKLINTKDKTIKQLNSEISNLREKIKEKDRLINVLQEQLGVDFY